MEDRHKICKVHLFIIQCASQDPAAGQSSDLNLHLVKVQENSISRNRKPPIVKWEHNVGIRALLFHEIALKVFLTQ